MNKVFNNLTIQWGWLITTLQNEIQTVIFPIAYTSALSYAISKNIGIASGSGNVNYASMGFFNFTATSVTTNVQKVNTTNDIPNTRWIAIGY